MIKGSGITVSIAITLPASIKQQMDKSRGMISRSAYIRKAVKRYMKRRRVG